MMIHRFVLTLLTLCGFVLCNHARAQDATFPSKPIRIVVPYPPGGFNDTLGRLVANKLGAAWNVPVVVENKPGGGTVIGTQAVASAAPDGYTLLVVQFPFATNLWLYKSLPYDTHTSFAPVLLAGRAPMVLAVNAASPIKTVSQMLEAAHARPGKLNYGSSGAGSSNHLAMALFESVSKTELTQIPYKGSSPMLAGLAGAQVEFAFDALPHVQPFIQSGKVRALAIASVKRSPLMPDLPTIAESGVPNYEVSSWHGFVVPAGTPQPVIEKLNREINTILKLPDVQEVFRREGVVIDGGTPAFFSEFIAAQMELWKKVIRQNNIVVE